MTTHTYNTIIDNTCTNKGKAAILRGKAAILTTGLRDS